MNSTILILPAAMRDAGNAVAEAMGWGPDNYSVPLSADGSAPATHYGLHAWTDDQFKGWVEGTAPLPDGMDAAVPVIAALIASFRTSGEPRQHFHEVLSANGLAQIVDIEA
jgi:hypothetical protein